jgi:hypothetical protein
MNNCRKSLRESDTNCLIDPNPDYSRAIYGEFVISFVGCLRLNDRLLNPDLSGPARETLAFLTTNSQQTRCGELSLRS